MKKMTLLFATLLFASSAFASQDVSHLSSFSHQQSDKLWKTQPRATLQLDKSDITMGYGGADMMRRLPTVSPIISA